MKFTVKDDAGKNVTIDISTYLPSNMEASGMGNLKQTYEEHLQKIFAKYIDKGIIEVFKDEGKYSFSIKDGGGFRVLQDKTEKKDGIDKPLKIEDIIAVAMDEQKFNSKDFIDINASNDRVKANLDAMAMDKQLKTVYSAVDKYTKPDTADQNLQRRSIAESTSSGINSPGRITRKSITSQELTAINKLVAEDAKLAIEKQKLFEKYAPPESPIKTKTMLARKSITSSIQEHGGSVFEKIKKTPLDSELSKSPSPADNEPKKPTSYKR